MCVCAGAEVEVSGVALLVASRGGWSCWMCWSWSWRWVRVVVEIEVDAREMRC